jgi:hypothetical protein
MAPTTRSKTSSTSVIPDAASAHSQSSLPATNPLPVLGRLTQRGEFGNQIASAVSIWADTPPVYTIDMSLPPEQRYLQVANDYQAVISGLPQIFDEVINQTRIPLALVRIAARVFLWRLCSREQTEEIRGISKAVGIDMYLMIAFNTLLDLFMGCTSGGVQVREGKEFRMLHFRTLDWGMDELRKLIVQLDFVEHPGGEVIAHSINYVGFVGILTGVRYL